MNIHAYLSDCSQQVEAAMARYMPASNGHFARHIEAMRYSLFAGGKRIRPALCLAAAAAVDDSEAVRQRLLPVACALEYIHTYSLIHDDLPAMDNDQLRRGKATNHILYGEAGAILAGDGLLTDAFALLSNQQILPLPASLIVEIIHSIAIAAGTPGMVGGQSLDIASEQKAITFTELQTIHRSKTGALISCAVHCGALGAGASTPQISALQQYAEQIGLAFQIVDDLLNATSTTEQLGKAAGSDVQHGKATYPAFWGIDKTRQLISEAVTAAHAALAVFDNKAEPLRAIASYIQTRSS